MEPTSRRSTSTETEDNRSASYSTTFSSLLRQLRGQSGQLTISAVAQQYIDQDDYGFHGDNMDYHVNAGPEYFEDERGFRDFDTVSSISRMSAMTDVIILSDPEFGAGQILSLRPPQPDEASVERPMQPPMRSIVAMRPRPQQEEDSAMDTIFLGDGVMKTRDATMAGHASDESTDDAMASEPSFDESEIVSKPQRRLRRITLLLLPVIFLVGGAAAVFILLHGKHFHGEQPETKEGVEPGLPSRHSLPPKQSPTQNIGRGGDITFVAPPTASPFLTAFPTGAILHNKNPSLAPVQEAADVSTRHPTIAPTQFPTTTPTASRTTLPTMPHTAPPTPSPTNLEEGILSILTSASPQSLTTIGVPYSPQNLAYQFLLSNTSFDIHSPKRVVQRFAMAVFYYAMGGDSWERGDRWLTLENECLWFNQGVPTCSAQGDLVRLKLATNNLMGELPYELGLLTELIDLQLGGNDIVGTIPESLARLLKLEKLDFSWTDVDGGIPVTLSQAVSLKQINLVGTSVRGRIPSELSALTRLEELLLAQTELTGEMPDSVCALNISEVWADCAAVECPCCNYCCYTGSISYCQYV